MKKVNKKQQRNRIKLRRKTQLSDQTPFSVKEAYKLARTNILFALADEGCKYIAITSAYPSEGKTTTSTNMALSFAQMKKRTLLIDADMRKPQIQNIFNLDNQIGLSNILGGFARPEEAIHRIESGLNIITAGHIPPNPVELLASRRMEKLLKALGEYYEYIFIDTPPVNVVTDALVLSKQISGVVVVTKERQSRHQELEEALGRLNFAKAKILGLILTQASIKSGKYGKYSKYSKYGKYKGYENYE